MRFAMRTAWASASSIRSTNLAIFRVSRSRAVTSLISERLATCCSTPMSCTNMRALARCRVKATCKSSRLAIATSERLSSIRIISVLLAPCALYVVTASPWRTRPSSSRSSSPDSSRIFSAVIAAIVWREPFS